MALAACYTIFNGLELLEKSIQQIESEVDFVVLCYQTTSNKGYTSEEVLPFLQRFKDNKKFHLLLFQPDMKKNTKQNERDKHQLMLHYSRVLGCTHFLLSACDHYYNKEQFAAAKQFHYSNNLDVTFTKMFTYYKDPTWQLYPMEDYYMPFIMKLYPESRIDRMAKFPLKTDPSVQINTYAKWALLAPKVLVLHHYSMIRVDIKEKFLNAAASIRWKQSDINDFTSEYLNYSLEKNVGLKYFGGRKVKKVTDYFNLSDAT